MSTRALVLDIIKNLISQINMNTSNQIWKNIFATIGVLAIIALVFIVIFRSSNSQNSKVTETSETTKGEVVEEDANPLLSESQENSLENLGFDPSDFPSEITPAMQVCFVEKLGAERAQEIKNGDSPTATDYFKAKSCLNVE